MVWGQGWGGGDAHDPASLVQVSYWLIALELCAAPGRPGHPSLGGGGGGGGGGGPHRSVTTYAS